MLIDADHPDPVEASRVVEQDALPLSEHGGVGGAPRHREGLGETRDGEVLADQPDQRPPQRGAGQLRPRLRGAAGVLAPHMPAASAPVAADRQQQRRRPPAHRLVRQATGDGVPRATLAAAAPAPAVRLLDRVVGDPAGQHRPIRLEVLADHHQTQLVEAAERRHIRGREGSV